MNARLVTISDIVTGYGSPQIIEFSKSLCEVLGTVGIICQPLVPQRPIQSVDYPSITIENIHTASHPHSTTGLFEYTQKCARLINRVKPDILIIANYNLFDVLTGLRYIPQKIIHLALEDLDSALEGRLSDARLTSFRSKAKLIDIWVFPESNRAKCDATRLVIESDRIALFYNVSAAHQPEFELTEQKQRLVYAGTLNTSTTVGRYIFDEEFMSFPIDIYGDLGGDTASRAEMQQKISKLRLNTTGKCSLQWFGQVPGKKLDEILPSYSFSLIYWHPVRHALLNAAPNKFFQAVASGVPVISPPHPQAKMLIERYGCGLLLEGWGKQQLLAGLQRASNIIGTPTYHELRANCHHAVTTELSWSKQMTKFMTRFKVKEW